MRVKFTGNNYSSWAFQFEIFLKGKDLWGHIDGMNVAPTFNTDKSKTDKFMSCLLGSVEPRIITNLQAHRFCGII